MKKTVLLITIFIHFNFLFFAQDTSAYIKTHACPLIADDKDTSAIHILKEDIVDKQLFVVGEVHDFKGNSDIYKALFFALNQRGIKHIVMELPFGMNNIISTYLNTGNTNVFGKQFNKYFSDKIAFFSWVYNYNKSLPDKERITIDCIDIDDEYDFGACVRALQVLLPSERTIPVEIEGIIKKIKSFDKEQMMETTVRKHKRYYKNMAYTLYASMSYNDSIYNNYFSNNYYKFKRCADGFYLGNLLSNYFSRMDKKREMFMYSNYLDIISKYKNKKLFCVHGLGHISTTPNEKLKKYGFYIDTTVMTMLNTNTESPVKEKVCTMAIEYTNINDKGAVPVFVSKLPFLQYSKTPLTLFKLNGINTPFDEKSIGGVEYLIINKN